MEMKLETLAIHAGHRVDPATGAVAAPIYMSTTFERGADGSYPGSYVYGRSGNPNREQLEECLRALEGGAAALAFASGSAATMSVFQALGPGVHVIAPLDVYYGTGSLLRDVFMPWGLEATFVDMSDVGQVEKAVRPNTRLIWVETPSNPLLTVSDIRRLAEIAHACGARCAVDNTWATPVLQRPIELDADIVMHSTTKYLGGHSDVLGGALVLREADAFAERLRAIQTGGGAVPSPFDCWLVMRGIQTLAYRMRGHAENAMRVAAFLQEHPNVERVCYPGLPDHPGHDIATAQMRGYGGMLSVLVKGDHARAMEVAAKVRLFTRATSLGGTESLIEHRASVEGKASRTPGNLLRVSVGLEHAEDLIADLAQALALA